MKKTILFSHKHLWLIAIVVVVSCFATTSPVLAESESQIVDEVSYGFSESLVTATTTIFSDNFSGSHPGSWSIGHDGGGGSYAWAWPSDYAHCYADPYGSMYYYPDNLHVYMERRNVSLSGYSNASLFFNYIVDTEASWDYFTVNVRDQSGSWHEVWRKSGITDPLSWSSKTLNLDSFAGQSSLYIQFRFDSDGSVSGDPYAGVYIDNVTLTAVAPQNADLELLNLTVSRPSDTTARTFTACSFDIKNNGPAALSSEGIMVDYYLSNDTTFGDADDRKIGDTGFTVSIASGATRPINLNSTGLNNMVRFWTECLVPNGNYYVFAKVRITSAPPSDPTSGNDYDRTNSTFTYSGCGADLVVTSVDAVESGTYEPGDQIVVNYSLWNAGGQTSNSFTVDFYASTNTTITTSDYKIGSVTYPGLQAGWSFSGSDICQFPPNSFSSSPIPPGDYYIGIIVTCSNDDNSSNNKGYDPDTVTVTAPADLAVISVDAVESGTYEPGDQIVVNYSLWNAGGQTSNSFTVDFYASTNTTITTSDYKIGSVTYPGLQAGWSFSGSDICQFPPNSFNSSPIPSGDYYIGIIVTCSNDSNPANDKGYDPDTVTVTAPDILIVPLTLDFESLVATTGGTATDSGESISHTALVTASVNDSNDIDSSYYYYYFDKKKPLVLDVNQIALKRASGSTQTLLQGRFEKFGILDADLEPWPIAGWTLANTPVTARFEEGIDQLVTNILDDEAADFVSPVFIGDDGGPVIITSTIFVGFNENVNVDQAEAIFSELEVDTVVEPNYANMKGVYRLSDVGRNGFEVLRKANSLAELLEVKFAEPDRIFTGDGSLLPNDPGFSQCWGIHNTGQSGGTADMDMDGPEAWDLSTGDSSIIVVVIDNGVQQNHPDIHQTTGADFTGQGGGGGPVNECDNHGTAVAGCVSAIINNSLGTVGIAPDCIVASTRVFISNTNPCDGTWTTTLSWTVDALAWAEGIGARVTNNSNSYGSTSSLIDTAYADTRNNGIVHFASAGNDALSTINYPASLPTVNAVAAVDRNGDLASFSNFGTGLAFSAPGQSIYTTDRTGSDGYSSGDYTTINGTSFASPYTAGVAALVLSVNPSLDTAAVEQILQQSAVDLGPSGYDTTFGWGFVNAFEAIKQASEAQDFTIYNDGTDTLTVSDITKENGSVWLSFAPVPPFDVAAGNSQAVTVSVDPTGLSPDTYSDRLLVYSNDPDESPYPGGVYVNLTVTCVSTTIEQPPQDITICEGQDAVFDIDATGSEPLHYQWKKDGVDVGIDSSTLTLYNMQLADDDSEIWCEVTNVCGSVVVSTSAFLTVYPWPTVTINPNPDLLNAGWTLEGPNGYTYSSNGDETITEYLEFGSYTITWSTIPRWNTPLPNPDTKNLSVGNSINFIGNYQLIGDLNNDYSVDGKDLGILVNYWLKTAPSIDMTGDDFINFSDFAVFGENWQWEL